MEIKSRLPGAIIEIAVKAGDEVKPRQILGKIEAMKMEQPIPCPTAGTVKSINAVSYTHLGSRLLQHSGCK